MEEAWLDPRTVALLADLEGMGFNRKECLAMIQNTALIGAPGNLPLAIDMMLQSGGAEVGAAVGLAQDAPGPLGAAMGSVGSLLGGIFSRGRGVLGRL